MARFKCKKCGRTFAKKRGLEVHGYHCGRPKKKVTGKRKKSTKRKNTAEAKTICIPVILEIPIAIGNVILRNGQD